jgi:hypothetical protein
MGKREKARQGLTLLNIISSLSPTHNPAVSLAETAADLPPYALEGNAAAYCLADTTCESTGDTH